MILRNFYTFLLALLIVPAVFAAETSAIIADPSSTQPAGPATEMDRIVIPPPVDSQPSFLGQDQYYTVTFRGNGEAVVTMKASFSNTGTNEMTSLTFKSPKVKPEEVIAYQIQREGQCLEYEPQTITGLKSLPLTPKCISFQEPDYNMSYFYGKTTYFKASVSTEGENLIVTLPKAVEMNKSGAIVLYYRGMGYTKKTIAGGYDYVFETLKSNDNIRTLQVGIDTDSDLVLKGSQGNVNYGARESAMKLMAAPVAADSGVNSTQFDNFFMQIGNGKVVKMASNLKPDESYTVTGSFAKSKWQVYGKEIALAIIVPLLLMLLVGIPVVRVLKKMKSKDSFFSGKNIMLSLGIGFITAIVLGINTAIFIFFTLFLQTLYDYQLMQIMNILLFLVCASLYLLFLVIPSVIIGAKKGVWIGVMTAISTICWLVLGLVFVLFAMFITGKNMNYPIPAQLMKSEPVMDTMQGSSGSMEPMMKNESGTTESAPPPQLNETQETLK